MIKLPSVCFAILLSLLSSCGSDYTPKPKGYFRIELPEKKSSLYSDKTCPYSFNIPQYAMVTPYRDSVAEPCWKYVKFPDFDAEIFLSYRKADGVLNNLIEDSRTLVYKHTMKASGIDETIFHRPGKSYGILYDLSGNAASPVQFFVTDSSKHFLRGALYFNVAPQPDSLAPVIQFLREDILNLMETVEWQN